MNYFYATIISAAGTNLFNFLSSIFESMSLKDVVDIILTAFIIGGFLWLFKKTKSVSVALTAIIGFIIFYSVAYWLNLYTVLSIANAFLGSIVVILVIIFQKELRRFVEWIDISAIRKRFSKNSKGKRNSGAKDAIDILTSTVFTMAKRKIGGLVVFPGIEPIGSFVSGGFDLDGKISDPLLLSIFDTSSPGHDGAIIIEQDVIKKFGVVLPLSERDDYEKLKHLGTRHRSALGLSERTDALCVIVSEEKGRVSLAFDGAIEVVESPEDLKNKLKTFLNVSDTNASKSKLLSAQLFSKIRKNILNALLALFLALVFWLFISYPQLGIIQKDILAPVVFTNVPDNATIDRLTYSQVDLIFLGSEKDFQLLGSNSIKAVVDISNKVNNTTTQYLSVYLKPDNIQYPPSLKLIKIDPSQIEFRINFK